MNRNTFILAISAFVVVALATPFQLLDVPLAPVAALVLGAIAGWWMSNSRGRTYCRRRPEGGHHSRRRSNARLDSGSGGACAVRRQHP